MEITKNQQNKIIKLATENIHKGNYSGRNFGLRRIDVNDDITLYVYLDCYTDPAYIRLPNRLAKAGHTFGPEIELDIPSSYFEDLIKDIEAKRIDKGIKDVLERL
jgi:hypothetical protein